MTYKKNHRTLNAARSFEALMRVQGNNTRVRPAEEGYDVFWSPRFIDVLNAQEAPQQ